MLKTCERYCQYTGLILAPSKCQAYGYKINHYKRCREILHENFCINGSPNEITSHPNQLKYFGIGLSAQKTARLLESRNIKEYYMIKLEKNVTSVLAISQKIQAIRTFLIPQLDFKFMNGQLKKKDVAFIDQKETHDSVNKLIGSRLPVGVHHGSRICPLKK